MKIYKFLLGISLLVAASCGTASVDVPHYKINTPSDVSESVKYYVKNRGKNNGEFISVSWVAFFNGEAIYVSSSKSRPTQFSSYPVAWSYVDSCLVFVYDNKYKNYISDSVSLIKEIDLVMNKNKIYKLNKLFVEDNLSLRFIRVDGVQTIDTSYLNVRVCKQLGRTITH